MYDDDEKRPSEAAALQYDPEEGAPKLVASGQGHIAETIIKKAREHNIPVYADPDLVRALNMLKLGDEIPPELYSVVAQILLFVSDMDKIMKDNS